VDYSVIIPTKDRPLQLSRCLASLAELDYRNGGFEVLVVDDGSAQPLDRVVAEWSSRLPIRLLTQPNAGPASARNRGAREANGEYLAFLDDDCRVTPAWLRGFADAHASAGEMLGGATRNGILQRPCSITSQFLVDHVCRWLVVNQPALAFFPSNNFAVDRAGFLRIGGFSEEFPLAGAEDREFCYRWLRKGGSLRFVPDAMVEHFHSLTFRGFWRQQFCYGRGAFIFRRILTTGEMPTAGSSSNLLVDLLLTAGREKRGWPALRNVGLLILSQVAYVAGFVREYARQGRSGRLNAMPGGGGA